MEGLNKVYPKDWRVKQMVDTCHVYYSGIWSRGDLRQAEALLDPAFVRRDLCGAAGWGGSGGPNGGGGAGGGMGLVVGPRAFRSLVEDVRRQYPDYYIEVDEVAVSDTHRLFVSWTSHGTQLEAPDPWVAANAYHPHPGHHTPHPAQPDAATSASASRTLKPAPTQPHHVYGEKRPLFAPASPLYSQPSGAGQLSPAAPASPSGAASASSSAPSYHNSLVHGVDIITFNRDRSKILEVDVFRQLSNDERRQLERRLAPDPLEIRLARLHWEQQR
ncbi:hypothetical protein GPECTOR_63g38 [Gonium pectorale]|uniref:SnoaL-like domain-containing protein n=1 Tax=Gonium pectorale TaxID=33097 RepID=A0A150G4G4_GONPE|nr:hypothetical protein GPECTOR_63g38 [Gonium pectorale]|eukprot:KXZ44711.1 hypothetical protein GPECTOR_63g38 [Gonium pectorale]